MSQAEIKNELTAAEAAASNNPENPGAEQAVQAKRKPARTKAERIARVDEQIAELQAKRIRIEQEEERVSKPKAEPVEVNVGEVVNVEIGRGETRRTVSGQVLAVFDNAAGQRKVKVLAGEGVDAQLVEAFASAVSKDSEDSGVTVDFDAETVEV